MTDRLHSYLIPHGAREASFRANVREWLGVVPSQAGAVLLACAEEDAEPKVRSGLVNAQGQHIATATADAPEWTIHVRTDGEEPPAAGRFIGGLAAHGPNGALAGIYIFVEGPHG